jgi:transcriptional regulator with XRE-family HTH domain
MTNRTREALARPEVRKAFEEELIVGEANDTVIALLDSLGITQKELARRLGVSAGRVSQILSGAENLTLRSLGALGWALGVRFELAPAPMANRAGTPAESDPPPPAWLSRMRPQMSFDFRPLRLPPARKLPALRVVKPQEWQAA